MIGDQIEHEVPVLRLDRVPESRRDVPALHLVARQDRESLVAVDAHLRLCREQAVADGWRELPGVLDRCLAMVDDSGGFENLEPSHGVVGAGQQPSDLLRDDARGGDGDDEVAAFVNRRMFEHSRLHVSGDRAVEAVREEFPAFRGVGEILRDDDRDAHQGRQSSGPSADVVQFARLERYFGVSEQLLRVLAGVEQVARQDQLVRGLHDDGVPEQRSVARGGDDVDVVAPVEKMQDLVLDTDVVHQIDTNEYEQYRRSAVGEILPDLLCCRRVVRRRIGLSRNDARRTDSLDRGPPELLRRGGLRRGGNPQHCTIFRSGGLEPRHEEVDLAEAPRRADHRDRRVPVQAREKSLPGRSPCRTAARHRTCNAVLPALSHWKPPPAPVRTIPATRRASRLLSTNLFRTIIANCATPDIGYPLLPPDETCT
ncbi:hypothetical protein ACQ86I_20500 [Prescottella equi]